LCAKYEDGSVIEGESNIDENEKAGIRIKNIFLKPPANINLEAKRALERANALIFGPGDLYTSILANCVITGVKEAVVASKATIVYVCNLMSRSGQTIGMHSAEYVQEIKNYVGVTPHHVIFNSSPFPAALLASYKREGNHPVENNITLGTCTVHAIDVVSTQSYVTKEGDTVTRSLIRHDSEKLSRAILNLL